jgi:hypothetical protein
MADDLEPEERREKWRAANLAGMLVGLLVIAITIAVVLGMFILAPTIKMTEPTPVPGQATPEASE